MTASTSRRRTTYQHPDRANVLSPVVTLWAFITVEAICVVALIWRFW